MAIRFCYSPAKQQLLTRYTYQQFYTFVLSGILLLLASFSSFAAKPKPFRTKNVIIVVIDGPRYSETWGNVPGYIPAMSARMRPKGVFFSNFLNDAYTYTNAGHTAITTGINQPIDNNGNELPANPSIFQHWLKSTGKPATAAWIITSKDKLNILGNTLHPDWQNKYLPSQNCGVNGPGSGYRADSLTLAVAKQILTRDKPNLVLINFMEPDGYAHAGNWDYYLKGISRDDRYVKQLWDFLRKNKNYKNNTTLLVTNDHGRHLDGIDGGWIEHGDNCAGCQHISLLALGPDFKKGRMVATQYTLVDIAPTIAWLLGFNFEQAQGHVIPDLFPKKRLKELNL
ncbi:sulfatase-like hydrolase/transferase [Pontibacter sp. 172403-2]|uniref:sulfatase-like hydrolase/transferase n=1 Tax=Pontibacter rufus TaxID=2791028 RepID=UPI0018AFB207|nr:sulfatase-like hydrolase/transferase [Pontibacter sp. 172403-2]MBF9255354.1 sulfatase-like hydrolase/transferase [Pontibacter sp. 172403-2]